MTKDIRHSYLTGGRRQQRARAIRVNALHPDVVGDSPRWRDVPDHPAIGRTPTKRLVTMGRRGRRHRFLLRTPGVNGDDLNLDAGMIIT
jgi:hypothetical protein